MPNDMTHLYLIRHGETTYNADALIQGHLDIPLSEKGISQARLLAQRLKRAFSIDHIVSSDLVRARTTAEIISSTIGAPITLDRNWREIYLGSWEGRCWDEIMTHDYRKRYLESWYTFREHGGESWEQMGIRIHEAISSVLANHSGKNVAIVTHGGAIRLAIVDALKLPPVHYPFLYENTSISELSYKEKEKRWWLNRMNDAGHLEEKVQATDGKNMADKGSSEKSVVERV